MNILLIEDSTSLRRTLTIGLQNLGFSVDHSGDGAEGLSMALTGNYQLLILDLMLPSINGMAILCALRKAQKDLKILVLSAKDLAEDKVSLLINGADDYLTKPFSFDELHARLLCLLRRGALNTNDNKITLNGFSLDVHLKQLFCQDIAVELTPNEYKIIECLFFNVNKVVVPEKISEYLVGQYDSISKNSIEAHLSSARKKIRSFGFELPIKTKRGFGYIATSSNEINQ